MDRPGNQALDLPGDHQPQQDAEDQDPQACRQRTGVERHRQLAAGNQQQVTGRRAGAGQGDHLVAAKFGGLPGLDVPVVLWQLELFPLLQLCQALAFAIVEGGCPQRRIAVELVEQAFGALW